VPAEGFEHVVGDPRVRGDLRDRSELRFLGDLESALHTPSIVRIGRSTSVGGWRLEDNWRWRRGAHDAVEQRVAGASVEP
jgi:hypothetical protein